MRLSDGRLFTVSGSVMGFGFEVRRAGMGVRVEMARPIFAVHVKVLCEGRGEWAKCRLWVDQDGFRQCRLDWCVCAVVMWW